MTIKEQQSTTTKLRGDILIVDDTVQNLRLLSTMLRKEGYNVRQALNGHMAMTAIHTSLPDLILLDVMMPDVDGYSICQQLKAEPTTADIPVIFLSALGSPVDVVKGFQVGGVDYITKPFHVEEVLIRVANHLTLKAATREIQELNAQLEARVKERTQQLEIANAQLLDMAMHDSLTGLANRSLFIEHLERSLNALKVDPACPFVLLFLDFDHFKLVNDSLGHLVGDELLIAIAHRLRSLLSKNHILARLGGDEFAILLNNTDCMTAVRFAHQLQESLTNPFHLKRHEVYVSASIGIVTGHSSYSKPDDLIRDADTAMYAAKASGRGNYRVFDPAMHAAMLERLTLETDLHRALQQQEFVVHYQPIVALATGEIVGFEALVRWQHPQRGLLMPGAFIPIAEDTGLIQAIGNWVMREACQQFRQWQCQGIMSPQATISINLAAQQLAQRGFVKHIDSILTDTGLAPHCLNIELTESALIHNPQVAADVLMQLRERHIAVSIDDFGTGYSSLSYLQSFPVDTLKIDRLFVQRLDGNPNTLGLVPLIIEIAQAMNMTVVAEGIETQQQRTQLQALQCPYGQGFLFSPPIAPDQVGHVAQARRTI
ncbi:MAG: EAL domain-containing protein [Cyanobacteria bacterium]|nr:EAL domain-containing protein [Cyanobacteriota bacterium]MDW8200991.1 EAL domain-containing protein [Cyanobacteriota bacterium SKYGB_h_bin112]